MLDQRVGCRDSARLMRKPKTFSRQKLACGTDGGWPAEVCELSNACTVPAVKRPRRPLAARDHALTRLGDMHLPIIVAKCLSTALCACHSPRSSDKRPVKWEHPRPWSWPHSRLLPPFPSALAAGCFALLTLQTESHAPPTSAHKKARLHLATDCFLISSS